VDKRKRKFLAGVGALRGRRKRVPLPRSEGKRRKKMESPKTFFRPVRRQLQCYSVRCFPRRDRVSMQPAGALPMTIFAPRPAI